MIRTIPTPILFAAYTVFSVAGMVLVKYAAPAMKAAVAQGLSTVGPSLMFAGGASMYVLGFLFWMVILTRSPLIVAYPIAVGLTMAFSTVCAALFLRESLSWNSFLGMLLVFLGVVLLAKG